MGYGLKFESVLKFSLENMFVFILIQNKGRLPSCKALYKRKLISINKWRQSTDPKKMAKVWPSFI